MNNRENDDELERMRRVPEGAASGRAAGHTRGLRSLSGSAEVPGNPMMAVMSMTRSTITARNTAWRGTGRLISPWRIIWMTNLRCLPRLRSSHGSSGSARGRQAQSAGSRQAQSGKSRQAGSAASNPDRARAAQTVSRNQRRAGYRRQDTMERGRASAGRQQGQMTKRRKKGRWKGLLLLLLAVFIGYGAWMFLHRPTGYWNIAVFGVDSRDGNTKNALADVQMICSIDRSTGEIRLVSVYRDTYLKINSEGTYHKINEAYFKGGHKQAVSAWRKTWISKLTTMPPLTGNQWPRLSIFWAA